MGNAESNPVRNMDKRTARREYRETFSNAIASYRAKVAAMGHSEDACSELNGDARPAEDSNSNSVRVCVRKRPIFNYEIKDHEFDVITCVGQKTIVVHDARMHADMKRQYLHHYEFNFDNVFSEKASNEEVYAAAASPLVKYASLGGFSTCLMYGQTGSGSKFVVALSNRFVLVNRVI